MATPNDIVEIVRSFLGDSLVNKKEDLALLVARQIDDPNQIVQVKTNCALFTLGVWWLAGVQHDLLKKKYVSGQAIAWVRRIAIDKHALRTYPKDGPPVAGAALHYFTPGKNDNHIETLLSTPDANMNALHGGAGRKDNAVTSGSGDIRTNYYRQLREWVNPIDLLEGSPSFSWNPAGTVSNESK